MPLNYLFFLVIVFALTAFIAYTTVATALLLRTWRPPHNPLLNRADTILRWLLVAFCLGLGALSGLDFHTLGWSLPAPATQTMVGAAAGLALALFFYATTSWLVQRTGARFYPTTFIELVAPRSLRDLAQIAVALIAVVLLEELLFRSLLIGGLSPLAPELVLAIVVGCAFGLLHSPQGLWGMAGAALAGVVLGFLFLWQHSVLAPFVAHYVANLVQLALIMRRGETGQTAGNSSTMG